MREPDLIELFVVRLNDAGINYIVTGSVASMFYGDPRVTHDIDLIVFLRASDIDNLQGAFGGEEFYLPDTETILEQLHPERRGHFNIIHVDTGLKADIYLTKRDEFHAWAFRNKRLHSSSGVTIPLAPPEYVIVRKLEYFREGGSDKHLRDISAMLAISAESIDQPALQEWIERRSVQAQWKQVPLIGKLPPQGRPPLI